ncbi:L-asparaginase 1 [Micractinium conductrix]|uniref:asparaginase n=1 Tax=Micractinium conductrix TaxID=554055 RepID=A0A2P6V6X1_9CHLO|nr:L-asparaginase 1 [Micractinium conductrix]|eukprot:PSC69818.1 L-asparaginase 1 [Micractinium conductrix]
MTSLCAWRPVRSAGQPQGSGRRRGAPNSRPKRHQDGTAPPASSGSGSSSIDGGAPLPLAAVPLPLASTPPDNSHNGIHLHSEAGAAEHVVLTAPVLEQAALAPAGNEQQAVRAPAGSKQQAAAQRKAPAVAPIVLVARPLPRVLLLHCGGTMGMDAAASYVQDVEGHMVLKQGTGGMYHKPGRSEALRPGKMLGNLLTQVPELKSFASLDLKVVFNLDSSNVGPKQWVQLAKLLDAQRDNYDSFLVAHGTDTLAYTASALSLMLAGFRKPIVVTGSQLPLALPRSDARQNLLDSLCCATASFSPPHVHLQEVAVCFGGRLLRGNRTQKTNSSAYQAFDSLNYPHLAAMGVDVEWNTRAMLNVEGVYRPRFQLDPNVMRVPIIPGPDPRAMYGDLAARGVKGIVLESFGVGNMPDHVDSGWLPWLKEQRRKGVMVYLSSQCAVGPLHPQLYKSGSSALKLGVESGPQMTPECAVVKLMLCLAYRDLPLGMPLAGEL